MFISSHKGFLTTTWQNRFSVVLFLYFSLILCTNTFGQLEAPQVRVIHEHYDPAFTPLTNLTYIGCFSRKNLDWMVKKVNSELTFVLNLRSADEFDKICKEYFKRFERGVNVIASQHQMLLCIHLPPQQDFQDFQFIQVPESQCSLRTSNSVETVHNNTGGTHALALYCTTPGYCLTNYRIVRQNSGMNKSHQHTPNPRTSSIIPSLETRYSHPGPRVNYTARYFDWEKHYYQTVFCVNEYRNPKQEASALLSILNSYVPYADLKPSLCVEYCNDYYNYSINEGSNNRRVLKYAVLSRTDTKGDFFGLCHCTDNINIFYPTTIKLCGFCKDEERARSTTPCNSHDFTTYSVYCNGGDSCKRGEAFISCKESATCSAKDPYGSEWRACPGEIIQRPCPNPPSKNGTAFWTCNSNGQFNGTQPDYDECISDELTEIENSSRRTDFGPTNPTLKATQVLADLKSLVIPKSTGTGTQPTTRGASHYFGHDISRINNLVESQVNEGLTSTGATLNERTYKAIITDAVKVSANLISIRDPWNQLNSRTRSATATECISTVEKNLFTFAQANVAGTSGSSPLKHLDLFPIDDDPDGFRVTLAEAKATQQEIKFPSDSESSFINIPNNARFPQQNAQYVGIQMKSSYMDSLTPPNDNSLSKGPAVRNSKEFNGNIISLTFSNATVGELASKKGVEIKIAHKLPAVGATRKEYRRKLHPGEIAKAVLGETVCAYWDTKLLLWSSDGCKKIPNRSNSQETVCECNHLTAFAVLTDVHGYIGKDKGLEILTLILCSLSIFCLIATIVILTKMKVLHGERSTITKHLCVNLIVGNLFLLLLVDREYFYLSNISCTLVGIITHYVFLSAFGWMAVQGLYLHRMVVQIFDTGKSYMLIYTIGAYSFPLIPIGLTTAIGYGVKDSPYGGEMFCWLNGDYIWAFLGPIAIILIANFIVMIRTMQTLHNFKTSDMRSKEAKIKSNRKWVKGCLALSVLLGLTWITGFFTLLDTPTFFFMSYVFTVLNASQGIFILIFYCLLHEKVKPLFLKKMDWLKSSFTKKTDATDSRLSAISKQTSSTRVPTSRSQENENSLNTDLDEVKFDGPSEATSLNQPNVHKYSDSSDYEDDEHIEMGLQEIPPPPYSTSNSEESENNEAAEIQAINSPSPISHNKVLEYYDEATRRESISSESEENESDVLQVGGKPTSLERRRKIIGPPWIDEMVESKLFIKRSKN